MTAINFVYSYNVRICARFLLSYMLISVLHHSFPHAVSKACHVWHVHVLRHERNTSDRSITLLNGPFVYTGNRVYLFVIKMFSKAEFLLHSPALTVTALGISPSSILLRRPNHGNLLCPVTSTAVFSTSISLYTASVTRWFHYKI